MARNAVFGGTGFLGRTFAAESKCNSSLLILDRQIHDLTRPVSPELIHHLQENNVSSLIISAAISNPDSCLKDPQGSHQINVTGMIEVLKTLQTLKIKPVFFSSDHVFDGQQGHYRETDPYCPITLYGQQKRLAEEFIRESFSDYLILRTSKQVAMRVDKQNFLSEMALRLLAKEPIRCATDHWIAPSFVEDIVRVTLSALERELSGVFHVAPPNDYSRLQVGHLVAKALGVSQEMVIPCSINDFKFLEVRPPRCTLNGEKLRRACDFHYTDIESGLGILKQAL